MDWIANADGSGKQHAVTSRERVWNLHEGWYWQGTTLCGRRLTRALSGGSIPSGIDCGSCQRIMRKEGYEV